MKHRRHHRPVEPLRYRQLCLADKDAISEDDRAKLACMGIVVIEKTAGRYVEFLSVDVLGQGVTIVQTKGEEE